MDLAPSIVSKCFQILPFFFLLCHKWIWPKIGNDEQKLDQLGRQHSADQDKPDDAKSSGPKPKRGTAAAQLIQIPKMSAHP
jgi:hypothetical protein